MMKKHLLLVGAAFTAIGVTPAVAAPFDGATLHSQYIFPDQTSVYQDFGEKAVLGTTLLGSNLGNVPNVNLYADAGGLFVDFSGSGSSSWTDTSFNGFTVFDDTNTAAPITSVTIRAGTNIAGLDQSRISFSADQIYVNWQGLAFNTGTRVGLSVNGASGGGVPEPATWATMLAGFAAIGVGLRRRDRRTVRVAHA